MFKVAEKQPKLTPWVYLKVQYVPNWWSPMMNAPIDSAKYEHCLQAAICWNCPGLVQGTVPTTRTQRRCPVCQLRWSHKRRLQEWEILKLFDQDIPILAGANQSQQMFTVPTVHKCYTKFRDALVRDYLSSIKPLKKSKGLFDQDVLLKDLDNIRQVDGSQLSLVIAPTWIMPVEKMPEKGREMVINATEHLYCVKVLIAEIEDFAPGSALPANWPDIAKQAKRRLSEKRNIIEANRLMYILEGAARYRKKPGEVTQIIYKTSIFPALQTTIGA